MITHQEADWTLLEIGNDFLFAREARGKLGVQNEAAQFFLIDVALRVQALGPSEALVHSRAPARDFVPHGTRCTARLYLLVPGEPACWSKERSQ
jgi:hypothetical protein